MIVCVRHWSGWTYFADKGSVWDSLDCMLPSDAQERLSKDDSAMRMGKMEGGEQRHVERRDELVHARQNEVKKRVETRETKDERRKTKDNRASR